MRIHSSEATKSQTQDVITSNITETKLLNQLAFAILTARLVAVSMSLVSGPTSTGVAADPRPPPILFLDSVASFGSASGFLATGLVVDTSSCGFSLPPQQPIFRRRCFLYSRPAARFHTPTPRFSMGQPRSLLLTYILAHQSSFVYTHIQPMAFSPSSTLSRPRFSLDIHL